MLLLALAIYYYFLLWQGLFFIEGPPPLWISDPRFSGWKNYVEMFMFAPLVAATCKDQKQIGLLIAFICISMILVDRGFLNSMRGRDLTQFSYGVRDAGPLGYAGVNGFAALQAMFMAFLLGIYSCLGGFKVKAGILLLLALSAYCLLFAFSRGGYAALLVALLVIGLLRNRKLLILLSVLLISWQTILPASVQERILMTTDGVEEGAAIDSSSQDRLNLWEDAFTLLRQNPVTGTGLLTYEYMGRVGPYRDTHNYFIKVLVETGVVGLVLFVFVICRMAAMGYKLFRTSREPFYSGVGLGFFALICSAIVLNMFGDRWTYQQVDGLVWLLLGCVIRGQHVIDANQRAAEQSAGETKDGAEQSARFESNPRSSMQ
jgi:O-antigen ligase